MKKQLIITIIITTVLGISGVGATWYFMDKNTKNQKAETDKKIEELEKQLIEIKNSANNEVDETSNWELYKGKRYTIKYDSSWVFKDDYSVGQDFGLVAFGDNASVLPKPQSDQMSAVTINEGKGETMSQYYKSSDKVSITNVKIGNNIKATKIVLSPGRDEEMYGDSKITYYDIEAKEGSYITISNFEDYKLDTFNKMLETFELK